MLVKMKTLMAGPDGVVQPGWEVDLPEDKAIDLIEGGYAVPVRKQRETAAVEPPEQAVALAEGDATPLEPPEGESAPKTPSKRRRARKSAGKTA